jgi:hypothetical protein
MNDSDREGWIMNDEGLYLWWRRSRMGISTFVRKFRKELTEYISGALNVDPVG